jgi:cyclopropane fatty-acyl-phospholipid synthase-like methyltransferase
MQSYSREFYQHRHENTVHSAKTILSILMERLPDIHSAVDIGCGVGTWLAVLREKGVEDVQGVDGGWVDTTLLAIPGACFKQVDLSRTIVTLPRRYDLAISLEVAEHLPAERAEEFVASLAALSDHVLFSAAIPHQGGRNHVNERWQHYWVGLFGALGYVPHDFIRARIWTDQRIPYWYRQNTLLFSKRQIPSSLDTGSLPLDVVHPDLFLAKVSASAEEVIGVKHTFRLFRQSLVGYFGRKLGRQA